MVVVVLAVEEPVEAGIQMNLQKLKKGKKLLQ
jgi:hypothetical protein